MESLDQIAFFDPGVTSNCLFSIVTHLLFTIKTHLLLPLQSQPVIARHFPKAMSRFWSAVLDTKDIRNSY